MPRRCNLVLALLLCVTTTLVFSLDLIRTIAYITLGPFNTDLDVARLLDRVSIPDIVFGRVNVSSCPPFCIAHKFRCVGYFGRRSRSVEGLGYSRISGGFYSPSSCALSSWIYRWVLICAFNFSVTHILNLFLNLSLRNLGCGICDQTRSTTRISFCDRNTSNIQDDSSCCFIDHKYLFHNDYLV